MRKALYTSILILLAVSIYAQKKEKITITGKVTVKDTGKPPIGIITVLELEAVRHWAYGDVIGTNNYIVLKKDGTFKLNINKGATIIIGDNGKRYNELALSKLDKTQSLNLKINRISGERLKKSKYPPTELLKEEKLIDPNKIVKIKGKIVSIKGAPIENVFIQQSEVFNQDYSAYSKKEPENSRRMNAFTTSEKDGTFSLSMPKGTKLKFSKGFDYNIYQFSIQNDTVFNLIMHRKNAFN